MRRKAFLVCHCTEIESITFQALRQMTEEIFENIGYGINRFAILFLDDYGKVQSCNCPYKQHERFDGIYLRAIRLIQFTSYYARRKHQQQAYMAFELVNQAKLVIRLVWAFEEDDASFYRLVKQIIQRFDEVLSVNYAGADQLEEDKDVELFVQGVSTNHRSFFENGIAHNNQLSDRVDPRMPFLYAYTLTAKGVECYFPQLLEERFENYILDVQWKATYNEAIANGAVLPLPR